MSLNSTLDTSQISQTNSRDSIDPKKQGLNPNQEVDLSKEFESKAKVSSPKEELKENIPAKLPTGPKQTPLDSKKPSLSLAGQTKTPNTQVSGQIIYNTVGNLYELDVQGKLNEISPAIEFLIVDHGKFDFRIQLISGESIVYSKKLNGEMNFDIVQEERIFKWVDINVDGQTINVYAVKIPDNILELKFIVSRCIFEISRQV